MKNLYYLLENVALPQDEKQAFFDLNKQEGDEIHVPIPGGKRTFEVAGSTS